MCTFTAIRHKNFLMSLPLVCSKMHFACQYAATNGRFQSKLLCQPDSNSHVFLLYGVVYILLSFALFYDGVKNCSQGGGRLEKPNISFKFQLFETEFNFEVHDLEVSKSANVLRPLVSSVKLLFIATSYSFRIYKGRCP